MSTTTETNGRRRRTEKRKMSVEPIRKQNGNAKAMAALIRQLTSEKLTIEQISEYIGKDVGFVSNVAAGQQVLTADDIEKLGEATGLPVGAMLADCLVAEGLPAEEKSGLKDLFHAASRFLKSTCDWRNFARKHA